MLLIARKKASEGLPHSQHIPPHQVNEITSLFDRGLSSRAISRKTNISRRCIDKIRINVTLTSKAYPKPLTTTGRHRLLNEEQELRVLDYIRDRPTSYHDETLWFIYDEFDVVASKSYVCKLLKRRRFLRKRA